MSKNIAPYQKPSLWGSLTGKNQLLAEKSRLEAFLSAFPGEYCGFTRDNADIAIYSTHFPALFGLDHIHNAQDLIQSLAPTESAALETAFAQLVDNHKNFDQTFNIIKNNKSIEVKGRIGVALNEQDHFYILWAQDVTQSVLHNTQKENKIQALQQKLDQNTAILGHLSLPLALLDVDKIIWCNTAYAKLMDSTTEQVIHDQKTLNIQSKDPKNSDHGTIIYQGKRQFVERSIIDLPSTGCSLQIITDRSNENDLKAQMARHTTAHETLLEQLRAAIALFDANQKLEFYNSAFSQLWGLEDQWLNTHPTLGEILEKLRETRRLPEQADFRSYKQAWLDMFTRLIDPHEDMLYLPDGSALRSLVVPHPMGGLMMIFEDVTSRLELESSYNTLIAVQKETLDNLSEGVAVYGTDGRLKLFNPAFLNLWNLNPEDMEGNPHISTLLNRMLAYFDDHHKQEYQDILTAHAIERKITDGRLARNNDTLLEYSTMPLPDGGVLVSYFDITDSVRVENALREKNIALEAAEKLKTDFLANVSYQLRTPLNTVMGFTEILSNQFFGPLNDKQIEYTTGIKEAGDNLIRLIDDILDLSTIEAGYLDLSIEEFNVQPMIDSLHDLVNDWARKENISMHFNIDADVTSITADQRRLKQVLLNVIHNAITYTPEKGKIDLHIAQDHDYSVITVSDTGVGIAQKDLNRIFEPFERAVTEHRAQLSTQKLSRGAGLGLSLVKNIVELHYGEVSIDSTEGQGTIVTVKIPRAEPL